MNDDQFWDGPEPSLQQRQKSWQFIIEYLKKYPSSTLKNEYPYLFQVAEASKKYDDLNFLRWKNAITEEQYLQELESILPLIQINRTDIK
jgi:hypothetical protein